MSSLHGLLLGRLSKQITCYAKMLKGMSDYKGMQFLHVHIRLGMACGDSTSATTVMQAVAVKLLDSCCYPYLVVIKQPFELECCY